MKIVFRVILLTILLCIIGTIYIIRTATSHIVSPVPEGNFIDTIIPFFTTEKKPQDLKQKIEKEIGSSLLNYSVVVHDFSSDFNLSINENMIFTAASINKLPILAVLYMLANKGDVDLDRVITIQENDIQDYGTGSIRYEGPGTTYSVKTLARLMMQKSDNTAAYILARQIIGIDTLQNILLGWGLSQTDMETNKTSNADMALLLERMYKEKICNHALTLELLSFLKDGEFEDRIPALLAPETIVYHKTGNGTGYIHDVGVVVTPKSKYYIGLFTSDVRDEAKTILTLQKVSKIIYDFMK